MVMINRATKEITLKIVYYGPGLCGKTTNLEYIYSKANPGKRGKLLTVTTETDRTLFFDFLPVELGTIRGMKVRVQLYTVPGQVFYDATRRIVLRGSDGVVFVADSQSVMADANLESVQNLKTNLRLNGLDPATVPLVFQYNKQDLRDLAPVDDMEEKLNWRSVPYFLSVATVGQGVNETLRKIIEEVIRSLHEKDAALKKAVGDKRTPAREGLPAEAASTADRTSSFSEVVPETDRRRTVEETEDTGERAAEAGEAPSAAGAPAPEPADGPDDGEEAPEPEMVEEAPLPDEPEDVEEVPMDVGEAVDAPEEPSGESAAPEVPLEPAAEEQEVLDLDALDDEPAPMEEVEESSGQDFLEPVPQEMDPSADTGQTAAEAAEPAGKAETDGVRLESVQKELELTRLAIEDFTRRLETLAREASALRSRIVFMEEELGKGEDG